jgi:hypothetical protein
MQRAHRSGKIASTILVLSVLSATSGRAECVILTDEAAVRLKDASDLVISGTVIAITRTGELGYRATFDVDRVWKGPLPKQADVYVWEGGPEMPHFVEGQHYVAVARKITSTEEMRAVGLGDAAYGIALAPVPCNGSLSPSVVRLWGDGKVPPR